MQYDLNAVGRNVANYRRRMGWTRQELTSRLQLLGCSFPIQNLAAIEKRQYVVRDVQVVLFSEIFRVPLGKLFPTRPRLRGRK
jgi:hypothetical protein